MVQVNRETFTLEWPAEHQLCIGGAVNFYTIVAIWEATKTFMPAVLDFSKLTHYDSACLALLIDWLRRADAGAHEISIQGLPDSLLHIADLYGIKDFLLDKMNNHDNRP